MNPALLSWDEADLEARLCHSLAIAGKTISFFAVSGYTDSESPVYSFGYEKPVAETAMLLYAASASAHRPKIANRVVELATLLATHARSDRVLADIALYPALAFKFAAPHILLTRLGYVDESFDAFLRSCVTSQAADGIDRPPSASLERKWISSLWTGKAMGAGWRGDLLKSVLHQPLDILGGRRDDAYAFTHLLMYGTDFGFHPRRLGRLTPLILAQAEALLARYLDAEDYDLAGEVLMAWPLTGAPWSASAAFGFRVLASIEDQAGMLPCGNINQARLTRLDGDERVRYALGTAYHTAYVMGFLCAAALRPDRVPPASISGPGCPNSCLGRLMHYVDNDQGHWLPEFSALAEGEQNSLTSFVLNTAIVQQCRKHNYAAVDEILSRVCGSCLAGSMMCRQATEQLDRLANCAAALSLRAATVSGGGVPLASAATTT